MTVAIVICSVLIIAVITGLYCEWRTRDTGPYEPRHITRRDLADPADAADPDGIRFVAELHHEAPGPFINFGGTLDAAELARLREEFEAALHRPGRLAIEPVPPPADTRPQPVLKDVAACELGMAVQDYVDGVFAPAEATIKALIHRYAEVTG